MLVIWIRLSNFRFLQQQMSNLKQMGEKEIQDYLLSGNPKIS